MRRISTFATVLLVVGCSASPQAPSAASPGVDGPIDSRHPPAAEYPTVAPALTESPVPTDTPVTIPGTTPRPTESPAPEPTSGGSPAVTAEPPPTTPAAGPVGWTEPERVSTRYYEGYDLLVSSDGAAHAAAEFDDAIWHLTNSGGSWTRERLSTPVGSRGHDGEPAIAVDRDGTLAVTFIRYERWRCELSCYGP